VPSVAQYSIHLRKGGITTMSIFYFEEIVKMSKENLDSVNKLIGSWDDKLRTATRRDLLQYKELLLQPIHTDKQEYLLNLLKAYISRYEKMEELMKAWPSGAFEAETNIPTYILKTIVFNFDSQYQADKDIASRYVDKFSRDCFASWLNNLPNQDNLRDILDLIVIAIIQCRGSKLRGKVRRFVGKAILKILGEYEK